MADRLEPPAPLTDFRFGAIAVWAGLVSQEALDEALEEQAQRRIDTPDAGPRIGEILVAKGLLQEEQVHRVLRVQLQRLPDEGHLIFGQIAGVSRLVSPDDIHGALDVQSRDILAGGPVRRIGEILQASGDLDEEATRAVLAFQATADAVPLAEATSARSSRPATKGGEETTPARDPAPVAAPPRPAPALPPSHPAFLPMGAKAFLSDNVIWLVLGIASVCALILIFAKDALFT